MDPSDTIVSSLPAGGWRIRYRLTNGKSWSEPLVGWAIYADGTVQALTADRSGWVEGAACTDQCEIYHPDEEAETGVDISLIAPRELFTD